MENIKESVLDPVQKTRCKEVFDLKTEKMKPEVREFILNILEEFRKNSDLNFDYTEIFMIGSSTGFQYTDTSDIDIEARVSLPKSDFKGKFSLIPKGIILSNTAKPINVFMLFKDDAEYNKDFAENIYNLKTDTWDKQSTLETAKIPYPYVSGLASFFMDGCEIELGKFARDKREIERYMNFDPEKVEISDQEKKEAIARKITDIQNDADALKLAHHFMFALNNEGFSDNPFTVRINYKYKDPHYSINNLIYKYVDSFGYYDEINKVQKEASEIIAKAKLAIKIDNNADTAEVNNKVDAQQELSDSAQVTNSPVQENSNVKLSESKYSQKDYEEESELYTWNDGSVHHESEPEKESNNKKDEEEISKKEKITEDIEFYKEVLKENGYEPTDKNVKILIEKLDDEYFLIDDEKELDESLMTRTEKKLNKIIYKASGKKSKFLLTSFGYLFGGLVGAVLLHSLSKEHNSNSDEKEERLYDQIKSDGEVSSIINQIKNEINNDKPDRKKLKELKHKFAEAVQRCKKEIKKDDSDYNSSQKISLTTESFSENELKDILEENGYAPTDKNINLLKNGDYILESRLPADDTDPEFGIPELKKYPLFDKAHVESAIKFFNYADEKFRSSLAKKILLKMKKYDISVDTIGKDNKLKDYIK